MLATTGTFRGPFGYGGLFGYREDASGLKLLGHRLYDPAAGRFLSRDPVKHGRNWYSYCGNDPVNFADPTGLKPGDLYDSPIAAGKAAVREGAPVGERTNEEQAGWIYKTADDKYSYTHQVNDPSKRRGDEGTKIILREPTDLPPGSTLVGNWHTHPPKDDQYDSRGRLIATGNRKGDYFSPEHGDPNYSNDERTIRAGWALGRRHYFLGGGDGRIYQADIDASGNFRTLPALGWWR